MLQHVEFQSALANAVSFVSKLAVTLHSAIVPPKKELLTLTLHKTTAETRQCLCYMQHHGHDVAIKLGTRHTGQRRILSNKASKNTLFPDKLKASWAACIMPVKGCTCARARKKKADGA